MDIFKDTMSEMTYEQIEKLVEENMKDIMFWWYLSLEESCFYTAWNGNDARLLFKRRPDAAGMVGAYHIAPCDSGSVVSSAGTSLGILVWKNSPHPLPVFRGRIPRLLMEQPAEI